MSTDFILKKLLRNDLTISMEHTRYYSHGKWKQPIIQIGLKSELDDYYITLETGFTGQININYYDKRGYGKYTVYLTTENGLPYVIDKLKEIINIDESKLIKVNDHTLYDVCEHIYTYLNSEFPQEF